MAPKDYSKIDDVTRGAQMAMQAAGIKDQRKQTELMAKFKEQQVEFQMRADERADIQSKIAVNDAKTREIMHNIAMQDHAQAKLDQQDEIRAKMMHQARLDNIAKDFDMPGTEHDYLNPLAQALIGQGELKKVADLVTGLTGKGPAKDPVFKQKIEEIMEVHGVDRQTAAGIATGTLRPSTNPVTGETVILDMITGTSRPITAGKQAAPEAPPPERETPTLWEMSGQATGALSSAKAAWGATGGQLGLPTFEKAEYARQSFKSAQNNLIRSLSINPRYPVAEMKRIQKEINISSSVFDSPQSLRTRMRAVDDYLRREIDRNELIVSTPGMPVADQRAALQAKTVIQHFLDNELGVPRSVPDVKPGTIEDGYKFKGGDPADPNNWEEVK